MNPIDPESLIYRFAKQLEFGSSMMQVASEAVRIVQRMNRDWMITGRRPAGICGAALILAARMNNFRRTVREVVYVVKVTELTINQRLNEFKATESGDLTVDQFRTVQLEHSHDPPAFARAREGKKKRKSIDLTAEAEDNEDEPEQMATPEASVTPPKKTGRVDADGFAIPDIPIDPVLLAEETANRETPGVEDSPEEAPDETAPRRGRPKQSEVPQPTAAELASESALEDEMTELLASGSNLVASAATPAPPAAAPTQLPEGDASDTTPAPAEEGDEAENDDDEEPAFLKTISTSTHPRKPISSDPEIGLDEFDSDPEVSNCLLSEAEVEIKERIWVHENKDYLRAQQAKAIKLALIQADPSRGPTRPRKRRRTRLGDVGYLNGEGPDGKGSRASTPAEATRMMLEQRGFSKKINYKLLEEMYDEA
jgi:transcription factor IIIB subunit 2